MTPPKPRKHYCCGCGRYLGEGNASFGYIVVKCPSCGSWRKIEFTAKDVASEQKVA